MTNEELAKKLETLSELLEITGENPFKAKAYLKAAQSIRAIPEDIRSLVRKGELEALPGIGKSISQQIQKYVEEGRLPLLEEIQKKIPIEIVELLKIPHIGPKTAKILFDQFGISNISDLKEALFTGKIKEARGISSKTLSKLRAALSNKELSYERMLLNEAEELSYRIREFFGKYHPEVNLMIAGSLRRGKETVGDLDFLIFGADSGKALSHFIKRTGNTSSVVEGEEITRVIDDKGVQFDFLITTEEKKGAALLHLTGSKEHNIRLRQIAKSSGNRLTHEGIFLKNGKLLTFSSEEELYEFLGLHYIPPELREDWGEIEAAKNGTLPKLLCSKDIKGDLHIHSDWSDSSASLEDLAYIAEHMGYEYISVTDHAKRLMVARGLTLEQLKARNEAIDEINEKYAGKIVLLKGIELNIDKDGQVDYEESVLKEFDFCIASLHWGLSSDRDKITERLIKVMQNPYVDAIGHPTTRLLLKRPEADIDFERVFEEAAKTGTLFEINSFPDRLDLPPRLIRLAKRYGVKFIIGTDSHSVSHLPLIKYGVTTARRGWLEKSDILNTFSLNELKDEIKKRRIERMKRYG
ncbi:MAG: DNA polymerase/3'-5' exonuclease PolX [Actinobacteria bacterium]|nr:DNA polymerase/3'-5' exonuclease PolX [Actinomycetota bacterium]